MRKHWSPLWRRANLGAEDARTGISGIVVEFVSQY